MRERKCRDNYQPRESLDFYLEKNLLEILLLFAKINSPDDWNFTDKTSFAFILRLTKPSQMKVGNDLNRMGVQRSKSKPNVPNESQTIFFFSLFERWAL